MQFYYRVPEPGNKGIIYRLLKESCEDYAQKALYIAGWQKFDDEIFSHLDTIGACCRLTYLDSTLIGFVSWDSRQFPTAIMGHNCILPAYRNRGNGTRQMINTILILKSSQYKRIVATTGTDAFFLPARKMYIACSFIPGDKKTDTQTITYELELDKI